MPATHATKARDETGTASLFQECLFLKTKKVPFSVLAPVVGPVPIAQIWRYEDLCGTGRVCSSCLEREPRLGYALQVLGEPTPAGVYLYKYPVRGAGRYPYSVDAGRLGCVPSVVRKVNNGTGQECCGVADGAERNGDGDEPYSSLASAHSTRLVRDSAAPGAVEKDGRWSKPLLWIRRQGSQAESHATSYRVPAHGRASLELVLR